MTFRPIQSRPIIFHPPICYNCDEETDCPPHSMYNSMLNIRIRLCSERCLYLYLVATNSIFAKKDEETNENR